MVTNHRGNMKRNVIVFVTISLKSERVPMRALSPINHAAQRNARVNRKKTFIFFICFFLLFWAGVGGTKFQTFERIIIFVSHHHSPVNLGFDIKQIAIFFCCRHPM